MSRIDPKSLHIMIGQLVRIVYAVDRGVISTTQGAALIVDDMITPPVFLAGYDPQTQTVTFQRHGSDTQEKIVPKEVLDG
jgi:hypothetical protein